MSVAEIRAFIAVPVDEAILTRLLELQQQLRQTEAPVSWTRPAGMHLTVKFLGNMSEALLPSIAAALAGIAGERAPFRISVEGTGGFPNLRRPRVLWAGIEQGKDALIELATAVDAALTTHGFPPETRPYNPHLTLGRIKEPNNLARLIALLQSHAGDHFGEMIARELILFRSELSSAGARYTPLHRLTLGAPIIE